MTSNPFISCPSKIAPDTRLALARMHVPGQRSFFFFGENAAVGTAYEDIWPTGGDIPWQTTASTVSVYSSDAAEVDSSLSYIRINKMHNETVGTYGGSHKGDITLRVTSGSKSGAIMSVMTGVEGSVDTSVQYGYGEAQNGFYSVPLGKVMYITSIEVVTNIGTNKSVDVVLYEREGILNTSAPFDPRRVIWSEAGVDVPLEKPFTSHIKIKALTDVFFRGLGSAASKIEVYCDFYLVDADSEGA